MNKQDKRPIDANGDPHGYWELYNNNNELYCKGFFINGLKYGYHHASYGVGHFIKHKAYGKWKIFGSYYFYHMDFELYLTKKNKLIL